MPAVCLGFRVHSGWAAVVALAGTEVLERARVELADRTVPLQPYHAAEGMPFPDARRLIERCEETTRRLAREAIERFRGHTVRAACVLDSSARPLPDLTSVLASHALIHTAEGELYREALRSACTHHGIELVRFKERDAFGALPADVLRHLAELGKTLGPPWRQDEKLAAAAAYLAGQSKAAAAHAGSRRRK